MTENLTRVPAKIFAENAPQNVVGQFGSALNGTKVNTTDVNIIQGLPAYTTGWSSAVISNRNYPTLEEMNGVMKTMSYQTAYNMQKGVAEWDNQTTYYTGDICKAVGSGVLYVSRADNNIGNPVSNTTYWQEYQGAQTSIPATNYIYTMDGNATYNNLSVTLPDMTLYIADGRSGNNSVNNNVVNVTSDTYTVSGNGEYTLFYNNTTQDLHLAPEYTVRVNDFPEGANYNDVCYKLDNRMYVVESINPNYSESAGVTVSDAGVVSGLGTLSLVFNGSIPLQPALNLDFTTGADVTTTQDLFTTPYAAGKISNGVFTTDLYSLAYSVGYYPQVYSGAYTLESQTVTYKYSINSTTYYTNSNIQVGSNLYTDEGLTTLYGTVTNLQNNTVTVSDIQTAYSGSFTQISSGSYYTYDLGGTNYYTLVPIANGVVVYTDTDTTDVFGTVTSVTGSTVLIQNTTQLYSGAYDDVTTSVYTYLLTSGPVYIYSAGVLIPGLTVYSDNTLTTAYGVVETITTSNVVIHSQNDSAGYVAQAGSGSVASGVSIYSDVNLQTLVATSTGANSTYTGSSTKSKVGTINYNVSASTQYSGSLEYNGTSYNLILNGVSSSFITSRNPYVDVQPAISFGGTNGFDGTIDISNMNMPNVWTWNGHNTTTPDWNVEPLCELGKITIENGAISDLKINYPIELVKFSDLEHLNLPQGGGGSGYQMFDIVMKDHVLTYEETLGFAPLGTYVYKEAIAGTRYGYPDFYQKCVDQYIDLNNTTDTVDSVTVTINANGHKFYDIADKATFDNMYAITGEAWYYGIDTTNERILLPRSTRFKNGTSSDVGEYQAAGLPNIAGNTDFIKWGTNQGTDGAITTSLASHNKGTTSDGNQWAESHFTFSASDSNSIYGASTTVEYSSTKLIPYMVVGNVAQHSDVIDVVDITTSENDTLPLGFSTYQGEGTQPSPAWLKSSGQWNSGEVYATFYNYYVTKIGDDFGAGKVIENTDPYTDYDLVLNQTDETFRLPLLNGSESVVSNKYDTYSNVANGNTYIAPANGWFYIQGSSTVNALCNLGLRDVNAPYLQWHNQCGNSNQLIRGYLQVEKDDEIAVEVSNFTNVVLRFVYAQGAGDLFFKVANAVQNLELLDAGEVLEAVNNISAKVDNTIHIIETYENGTSGYIIWSNGYCEQWGTSVFSGVNAKQIDITFLKEFRDRDYVMLPSIGANTNNNTFNFISYYNKTTTTVRIVINNLNGQAAQIVGCDWEASGYLAEGEY